MTSVPTKALSLRLPSMISGGRGRSSGSIIRRRTRRATKTRAHRTASSCVSAQMDYRAPVSMLTHHRPAGARRGKPP